VTDLRELQKLERQFWRAPSAHNTQPWLVTYGADRVELRFDPDRALPAGDPTQRDLLLSLGAFAEGVLIATANAGVPVEFQPGFDATQYRVGSFVAGSAPYATLFAPDDLERRQTSRLAYLPGFLTADELAEVRAQLSPDADLHDLATRDLVDLAKDADRHLYESADVVAELRGWLRLSPRDPRFARDGLSYDCLNLSRLEARAVALLLRPGVHLLVRRLGLHRAFSASTIGLLERDGSALVLTGTGTSAEEILEHGRSLYRAWLALGKRGLYAHPFSQILDCPTTERELAARLGVTGERRLLAVFRAGRSERPARSRRLR
jgi:hypothetical protein